MGETLFGNNHVGIFLQMGITSWAREGWGKEVGSEQRGWAVSGAMGNSGYLDDWVTIG